MDLPVQSPASHLVLGWLSVGLEGETPQVHRALPELRWLELRLLSMQTFVS
jgi:hypothetical protein